MGALQLWERVGRGGAVLLLPLVYAACCGAVAVAVALAKWTVMGRFRPFEHPPRHGTPLLPWYFRLLGARIGRRTYFHTTGLLEFDLVEVGDGAAVNEERVLQTHLFEDRVLKDSRLRIGQGCTVGAGSVRFTTPRWRTARSSMLLGNRKGLMDSYESSVAGSRREPKPHRADETNGQGRTE